MKDNIELIAEIGSVHDGSLGNARQLIKAAAQAGAHQVKFQWHMAQEESLPNAPAPSYFQDEPRLAYFERTAFSPKQWRALADCAQENNVGFLVSPFSLAAVDALEQLNVSAYKVPSGEVTNHPLLEHIAATGKPTLLSSGMSTWAELDAATAILSTGGPLTILQCTSQYPCPPEHVGLNIITQIQQRYPQHRVGFSDHTRGLAAPLAAAALGAQVIEKHFAFSRLMYGSDAHNALEPQEFQQLAQDLAEIQRIQQHPVDKDALTASLQEMKQIFEKSVVTREALAADTIIERKHLAFKKPGDGIGAHRYKELLGHKVRKALPVDHPLSWQDIQES